MSAVSGLEIKKETDGKFYFYVKGRFVAKRDTFHEIQAFVEEYNLTKPPAPIVTERTRHILVLFLAGFVAGKAWPYEEFLWWSAVVFVLLAIILMDGMRKQP